MRPRPEDSRPRVLIVEGRDDQYVTEAILKREGLQPEFTILPKCGAPALLKGMRAEVKVPGRVAVGFVIDANSNPASRWREVTDKLQGVCAPPSAPSSGGTIVGQQPRVGIWMMPDNGSSGELEDFVRSMVPPDDSLWLLAETYIAGIPEAMRRFPDAKYPKAVLHAWLAAKRRPGRMAAAIRAGDLETRGELVRRYVRWLRELFY